MTRNSRFRWLVVLVIIGLMAGACGGSGDDSSTASGDGSGDNAATDGATGDGATGDGGSSDGAEPPGPGGGGTLVVASTQVPRTLNGLVQSGYATALPGTQLNAGLLRYDDNYEPIPYLATSWELADDGLSATFNLVEGATFHDGSPITSEDVAFSIMTAKEHHPFKPMFAPVTSVDTPDPQTVVINLDQPHPALLLALNPALCPILPKAIYDDGQDITTHPRNTTDFVGSGPFMLEEYNPESVIRLKRYEGFFLPNEPKLDNIIIQITADPNAIALGVENGDIQLTIGQAPSQTVSWRDGSNPNVTVDPKGHEALGQLNWLEFNLNDPDLAKPEVRQAIAYAIDKDAMIQNVELGLSERATTAIAPASPFYNPDAERYDQNVEKAKQLLADAGYAEGDLSLSIDYIPPIFQPHAEYIVQQLQDVGINAEVRASPDFPTWAERISSGDFQATVNNVWNWGDPVIGVARSYLSTNRVGVIWTNNTGYENATVDQELNDAAVELDLTKRTELYADFQDNVNADVPMVFLSSPTYWQAYGPTLHNPPQGIWGQMSPMLDVWVG